MHTGFEWNKYNQTHYDIDNPPPKVVQGYKFNIFYPDLIDKARYNIFKVYLHEKSGDLNTVVQICLLSFIIHSFVEKRSKSIHHLKGLLPFFGGGGHSLNCYFDPVCTVRMCPIFKWLKPGWMPNVPVFKCHLKTGNF